MISYKVQLSLKCLPTRRQRFVFHVSLDQRKVHLKNLNSFCNITGNGDWTLQLWDPTHETSGNERTLFCVNPKHQKLRLLLRWFWPGTDLCLWICGRKPETLSLGFFITVPAAPETGRKFPGAGRKKSRGAAWTNASHNPLLQMWTPMSQLTQWWKSEIV